MSNIAIVTDSNSGISQEEAKSLGIHVLPMPFFINEKEYHDGIDFTVDDFYQALEEDADVATSMPSPGSVMDLWDELLKNHDEILYIPMSSALSGSAEAAISLALDYDGKVVVVNNQRISVLQRSAVLDAINLVKGGVSATEAKEILEKEALNCTVYLTVDTMRYLKKGGRITPAAAAIGTVLNIKPVLTIQGGKLEAFAKARGMKQAKKTMMTAMREDLNGRFAGQKIRFYVAHTSKKAPEELALWVEEVKEAFPEFAEVEIAHLSLSVACHTGPGVLAVAASKVVE